MRECVVRIPVFLRETLVPCTWASGTTQTRYLKAVSAVPFLVFAFVSTELAVPLVGVLAK